MTETEVAQPELALENPPAYPISFAISSFLLASLICGAIAPTLTWLQFSNGSEGLNVGTVQEMYRTGEWLIPTLQGSTRLAKPPLTAWITASAVSSQTVEQIASTDAAIRDQGYLRLSWETRWPTLFAGFLTLLLVAELGRLVAGPWVGIASLIVTGSSLVFLRFIRYSSTDVQLMLWVAAANVFLAHALLRGRFWMGCIGAGLALGLGMMGKGPLILVQSVIPFVFWLLADRKKQEGWRLPPLAPILSGTALFILVGISWFLMVYLREPRAISIWISEITREGATDAPPDGWYKYFSIFPLMAPWIVFFALGLLASTLKWKEIDILPLFLLLVPIVIMSFAKDKTERYLLPMLPAAAIVTAIGLRAFIRQPLAVAGHWVVLVGFAIGFPFATMLMENPWATPMLGGLCMIAGTLIVALGIAFHRRFPAALLYSTLLVMLGQQALFIHGYRYSREGSAELRPMAELLASDYSTATYWRPTKRRPPTELGVYLNRTIAEKPIESITPTTQPQIIILEQNKGEPYPTMPPPWQFLTKYPRDTDVWWAFILPPG